MAFSRGFYSLPSALEGLCLSLFGAGRVVLLSC